MLRGLQKPSAERSYLLQSHGALSCYLSGSQTWVDCAMSDDAASARSFMMGIVYILLCAAIWTAASVVKKIIFDQMDFPYPFVICVFANTCYVMQFLTLAMRRCTEKSGTPRRAQLSQPLVVTQQRKDRPDGIAESDAPEPEAGTQDFRIATLSCNNVFRGSCL